MKVPEGSRAGALPRFGVAVPQTFHDPAHDLPALKAFIRRVEALGFDSLWVQEQLLGRDPSFEPLVTLAYAAALTDRVRLGSAAFITPIRSPIHLAKELASVDQLSNGRLIAGVALGDIPTMFPMFGVRPEERLPRFLEGLEVMRRLWTEPTANFAGRFWRLDGAAMEPKPIQQPHPPIWFGGKSDGALRRAVRLGSGWVGAGGSSTADFRRHAALVRAELVATGTSPSGFAIAKKAYLAVETTRERAQERLLDWFTRHWPAAHNPARLAQDVPVFGTPAEVAAGLRDIIAAGAELVILNPVFDESRQLTVLAEEVIPAVLASLGASPSSA